MAMPLDKASIAYLVVVLFAATRLGRGPAIAASVAGSLLYDFFFTAPYHELTINDPSEWLSLGLFLATAIVTSTLAANERTRADEARRLLAQRTILEQRAAEAAMVSRAADLRTAILRALSADLRKPLGSIAAAAAVLRRRELAWNAEEVGQFAASVEEQTRELERLATDIVDISRIKATALRPRNDADDLARMISDALEGLRDGGVLHRGRGAGRRNGFRSADLMVDLDARRVTIGGADVRLTRTEFELLAVLVRNAGRVVRAEALLDEVWGTDSSASTHSLHVYVARLRRKIEPDPEHPRYLATEVGVGYRFVAAR